MRDLKLVLVCTVLGLSSCASPPPPKILIRTDGQHVTGNAALEQQVIIDKTVCGGDAQKADLSAGTNYYGGIIAHSIENNRRTQEAIGVFEGCMASKGYVMAPADQAQAMSDSFAATARERQKLTAPAPTPATVSSR